MYQQFKDHFYKKDWIKSGSMLAWFIWLLSGKGNATLWQFYKLPIAIDAYKSVWYYAII